VRGHHTLSPWPGATTPASRSAPGALLCQEAQHRVRGAHPLEQAEHRADDCLDLYVRNSNRSATRLGRTPNNAPCRPGVILTGMVAEICGLIGEEISQRLVSRCNHITHAEMLVGVAVGLEIDMIRIQAAD
jgi:hypothetical protein